MQKNKGNERIKRNEELRFLYEEKENKKKAKPRKRADKKKSAPKQDNNKFNFDNEIVIGVTVKTDNKKNKTSSNSSKKIKQKNNTIKNNKQKNKKEQVNRNNVKEQNKKEKSRDIQEYYDYEAEDRDKRKSKVKKILIYILLTTVFAVSMILFLLSPVFNVTKVQVTNNSKINADTYVSLSGIIIGENTFKILKHKVVQNIKQEPYVEDVQVIRQLPDKIELIIKERTPTLMIQYANSYVYLNNQGYILEIAEEKLNVPIIKSFSTLEENIKPGTRLNSEDLEKLNSVLKIVDAANGISIGNFITYIDISNKNDYIIRMDEKRKTIHLGDDSNLSNKLLYTKAIIEKEEGVEGEILAEGATKGSVVFQYKE